MFLAGFHAAGRHNPYLLCAIDFTEPGADHFLSASRREDREFKRSRSIALLLAQLDHKIGKLRIGEGGVVLDGADFRLRSEFKLEMAPPSRGILPCR